MRRRSVTLCGLCIFKTQYLNGEDACLSELAGALAVLARTGAVPLRVMSSPTYAAGTPTPRTTCCFPCTAVEPHATRTKRLHCCATSSGGSSADSRTARIGAPWKRSGRSSHVLHDGESRADRGGDSGLRSALMSGVRAWIQDCSGELDSICFRQFRRRCAARPRTRGSMS